MTPDRAEAIVRETAARYPGLMDHGDSEAALEELLLRMIWSLNREGLAGRQRNPSGAISHDKLTVYLGTAFRAYDVLSTRTTGPMDVHFDEVGSPNYVADPGLADAPGTPPPVPPSQPEPPPVPPELEVARILEVLREVRIALAALASRAAQDDASNERRYRSLADGLDALAVGVGRPPPVYTGSVRVPVLGTLTFTLTPRL